jgi:hypothetical protein
VILSLSPAWFRHLVSPAHYPDWDTAERALLADPHHRRRIAELETELRTTGLERPVAVGREHWWNPRPRLYDGLHRSIAAMRLGMPVTLRFGYDDATDYDHSDLYRVTATGFPGDLDELVMDTASFRCTAGPWIQCDSASGVPDGPVDIPLPHHPALRALIAAELQQRLRDAGARDAVVEFLEHRR